MADAGKNQVPRSRSYVKTRDKQIAQFCDAALALAKADAKEAAAGREVQCKTDGPLSRLELQRVNDQVVVTGLVVQTVTCKPGARYAACEQKGRRSAHPHYVLAQQVCHKR